MQIDTKALQQRGAGTQLPLMPQLPVSTPAKQAKPVYKTDEVTLTQVEAFEIYLPYGKAHAEKHGFNVFGNLAAVMKRRVAGEKVVSLREADIAARCNLDLTIAFPVLVDAGRLLDVGLGDDVYASEFPILVEDLVGLPDSIYELRRLWNRGTAWNKNERHKHDDLTKQKADKTMGRLRRIFEQCLLPVWPEEEERGFHPELTKPEFQTFAQYEQSRNRITSLVAPPEKK